jgi:hybrid cluster-associated redox disulfide protein
MRRWPATTAVVVRHRLLCVGCPVGSFHTVAEACEAHGVEEHEVVEALLAAIAGRSGAT